MDSIKQYIAEKRAQSQRQKEENLRNEFEVVERGGYLWLTHEGVAFMKCDSLSYSGDVASELKKVRTTAIEFAKL